MKDIHSKILSEKSSHTLELKYYLVKFIHYLERTCINLIPYIYPLFPTF